MRVINENNLHMDGTTFYKTHVSYLVSLNHRLERETALKAKATPIQLRLYINGAAVKANTNSK